MRGRGERDRRDADVDDPNAGVPDRLSAAQRGLPAVAWVFLALAGLVGLSWAASFLRGGGISNVLFGLGEACGTALPVALLYRRPDPRRSHGLLFSGLAAGSFASALSRTLALLPQALGQGASTPTSQGVQAVLWVGPEALGVAGTLLVALGLTRLRERPPGRQVRWLLPVLVLAASAAVAARYLPLVAHPASLPAADVPATLFAAAILLGGAPIGAYAAWVPLAAWIDREPAGRFWTLLGLASLAGLGIDATTVAVDVSLAAEAADLFVPLITLGAALGAVAALPALIAYGWFTPSADHTVVQPEPADLPDEFPEPVSTVVVATARIRRR